MALVKDLRENYGIFCSIVVYPVIPKGLNIAEVDSNLYAYLRRCDETLKAFSVIRERLEKGVYKRLSASVLQLMGE